MTTRRVFLKSSVAGTALSGATVISLSGAVPAFLQQLAQPQTRSNDNILVVVQLSGGNDGLNTVVPYGDDLYYRNRFTLAIPQRQVLKIDDRMGFHPALAGFGKLLDDESLAVVQGVGYPHPNRSHFQSMDLWHTAHRKSIDGDIGWLGRVIEDNLAERSLPAIHLGREDQPLALMARSVPIPSVRSRAGFRLQALQDPQIADRIHQLAHADVRSDNSLLTFARQNTATAIATSQQLRSLERNNRSGVRYPNTRLANKLNSVGQLIGSGLQTRIYYVVLAGFDTHSNQAAAHESLLRELGDALAAFGAHLREQGNWERVCVLTFSEFGRRVRENASRGTDHGTAAPVFLAGGRVQAGLVGDYPDLSNLQNGDLTFSLDYRRVYASLLENWLKVPSQPLLGDSFNPLPLFAS